MSIDIKRFVNIDIQHKEGSSVNSIRDTVALLSEEECSITLSDLLAKAITLKLVPSTASYSTIAELQLAMTISSYKQFYDLYYTENSTTHVWSTALNKADNYAKSYFNNNGNKLIVLTELTDAKASVKAAITALKNELIVVAYTGTQSIIKQIAQERETDVDANNNKVVYGINRKLLLMSVSAVDTDSVSDLVCKYTNYNEDVMTIAAYLSNIDFYGINTVQDYCFTKETVKTVVDDDSLFETLSESDINVDVLLGGAVRNYGGNCKDGLDLVNEFALIVLQQTVTDRVLQALTSKLKNESGLAIIKTVMSEELNKYARNGYLNRSAIWTDRDYTVVYNNETYTVVEQDTALPLGYRIKILPYSSLTNADKIARTTPPIYIAIADSYGIRKVTINGQVF